MSEALTPSASLLCKLASVAVHADESTSPGAHEVDTVALRSALSDPEVITMAKGNDRIRLGARQAIIGEHMAVSSRTNLPKSWVYNPWELVEYQGKLRLVFMVKLFGFGGLVSSFEGGRGYFVTDSGELESPEPVEFRPIHFVYNWRNRPSTLQLQKARDRHTPLSAAA